MAWLASAGTTCPLGDAPAVIGRHRTCAVRVGDDAASRQHARVRRVEDGSWWVEDLGSANGTRVNGEPLAGPRRLVDGDVIAIGVSTVVFHDQEPERLTGQASSHSHIALGGMAFAGFRLGSLAWAGALGAVYRAGRGAGEVAVRIIDPALVRRDPGLGARLAAEAARLGRDPHPCVASPIAGGVHDGLPWVASQALAGTSLRDRLAASGPLAVEEALRVGWSLAETLAVLHGRGQVHGDLRPATVAVGADGTVRLLDPGLGHVIGTPELPPSAPAEMAWYLNPAACERAEARPEDDLYALGCLLAHLLAGQPPFPGEDAEAVLAAHRAGILPDLDPRAAVVADLLACGRQPSGMGSAAGRLAGALAATDPHSTVRPAVPAPRAAPRPWWRRWLPWWR